MAKRGVWQLSRLTFTYCDFGGSSRGAREFIEKLLPTFSKVNPQLETSTVLRRGHHPFMVGEFINGTSRSVDMRNQDPNQVMRQARYLRDALGRKTSKRVKERVQSKLPSIQGTWTAELQDSLKR